jgi:hypothetical protein
MQLQTDPYKEQWSKNRPVHEVRIGRVKAAVWENETQNGSRFDVTVMS